MALARPVNGSPGLVAVLVGDGRPLIAAAGLALLSSGLFAVVLGVRPEFLPHDVAFLGMMPDELCAVSECRVVHFMIHDRIAFGGVLAAVGLLYLWLAAVSLAARERWAWWVLAASGAQGFASFLAYLGYAYLGTWHGAANLVLLPCFAAGMALARCHTRLQPMLASWSRLPAVGPERWLLLFVACWTVVGGVTITAVGITCVFVPEDVASRCVGRAEVDAVDPRRLPLLAHDRAGVRRGGRLLRPLARLGGVVR